VRRKDQRKTTTKIIMVAATAIMSTNNAYVTSYLITATAIVAATIGCLFVF